MMGVIMENQGITSEYYRKEREIVKRVQVKRSKEGGGKRVSVLQIGLCVDRRATLIELSA